MKNFQSYAPEKYTGPAFEKVEKGIYLALNPYKEIDGMENTSLTFEMEPNSYSEEGGCPQDITQVPFEDILDEFCVYVTDFYEEMNRNSDYTCYQEFGSGDLENIRKLRGLIGRRFYAIPYEENEEEYYRAVIE